MVPSTSPSHRCGNACSTTCGCGSWRADAGPLSTRGWRLRSSSNGLRIPPPSRICGDFSCTWSITGPRRFAQRYDYRVEVLLRRDARPGRVDGEDAAGARPADVAGGVEPDEVARFLTAAHEPEAPDGTVSRVRRRSSGERGDRAEGRRHRQPADDAAHRAGQGSQGSLRHVVAAAARTVADVVASGPRPGEDARGGWLFPGRNPVDR